MGNVVLQLSTTARPGGEKTPPGRGPRPFSVRILSGQAARGGGRLPGEQDPATGGAGGHRREVRRTSRTYAEKESPRAAASFLSLRTVPRSTRTALRLIALSLITFGYQPDMTPRAAPPTAPEFPVLLPSGPLVAALRTLHPGPLPFRLLPWPADEEFNGHRSDSVPMAHASSSVRGATGDRFPPDCEVKCETDPAYQVRKDTKTGEPVSRFPLFFRSTSVSCL